MSSAEVHFQAILDELGWSTDPEMARTAERFIGVLKLHQAPAERFDFSVCAAESRVPVIARNIPLYSLCAHHLLPFIGTATIAYEPDGKLVGLGALPRLVQHFARRPQIQERLTEQIAHQLFVDLAPKAVVVKLSARHMCVEMRSELSPQSVDTVVVLGEPGAALKALL